jgi:hypothetical protein
MKDILPVSEGKQGVFIAKISSLLTSEFADNK